MRCEEKGSEREREERKGRANKPLCANTLKQPNRWVAKLGALRVITKS